MPGTFSRRKFLKETAFGLIVLSAARFIPLDRAAAALKNLPDQLKFFSPMEFLIMENVAGRIVGTPAPGMASVEDVGVALRADAFLAGAEPEIQNQLHELLAVFNGALFAFLFEFQFSSFVNMSPEDQDAYLNGWMTSSLAFRRTAFQALKRLSLTLFYTDPRAWEEIRYDGMFLPWEREKKQ